MRIKQQISNENLPKDVQAGLCSVLFIPHCSETHLKHLQAPSVAKILSHFSESYDIILQAVLSHFLSVKQEDLSSACLF